MKSGMDNQSGVAGQGHIGHNPSPISRMEFDTLVEMIGSDMPEILVDLLDTYLEESSDLVSSMKEAYARGDFDGMLRPSHSLKSSSASVGAMVLSERCAELENFLRGGEGEMDFPQQLHLIEQEHVRVYAALELEKEQLLDT